MSLDLLIARNQDLERRLAEMETVEGGGGGGLTVTSYVIEITSNSTNNTTTWSDVTDAALSHTFSRTNALIVATHKQQTTSATVFAASRLVVDTLTGSKESGVRGSSAPAAVTLSEVFDVSGLSGAVTVKLQHRSEGAGPISTVFNQLRWNVTIIEYD